MKKLGLMVVGFLLTTMLLVGTNGCTVSEDGVVEVVPLPPSELKAAQVSGEQVDLSWKDNSTNETGFKIERKTDSGIFTEIGSTSTDVTTFSDKTLSLNTNYTYRVYSLNQVGKSISYSNEVTVKTFNVPALTTTAITEILPGGAKSGGTVSSDGGSGISARGVVWGTSTNPTIASSTKTSDGTGVGAFQSTITGLAANTKYYVRAYATNGAGTTYGNELSFTTTPTFTFNTVTGVYGRKWMDRNLGASRVATSITDAEAFGDLYQWGRGTDGHQKRNSGTTSTLSSTDVPGNGNFILTTDAYLDWRRPQNNNLWQGVNGINNPCPSGFRLPNETEFYNESRSSGGSGPFASSPLKLTRGGYRNPINGLLDVVGGGGYYWTSTVKGTERIHLILASNPMFSFQDDPGSVGMSVRCIEDFVVTNTPTTIIEVTNPKTGKTWMDRNLGASRVATSSTDIESYGDLYQWGRRSDGHQNRVSEPGIPNQLSSVDIPGNAYFILSSNNPFDWRSPQNNNLWQGVNAINNPCPSGFRLPTETELNAERLSWNSNNAAGAFASPLKLPLPGYRYTINSNFPTPNIQLNGVTGFYWSSSVSGTNSIGMSIEGGVAVVEDFRRANGFSVRCIKN